MVHCGCWTLLPASAQDCVTIMWEDICVILMMLDAEVTVGGVASLVEVELLRLEYMVLPRLEVWLMSKLRFMPVTPCVVASDGVTGSSRDLSMNVVTTECEV